MIFEVQINQPYNKIMKMPDIGKPFRRERARSMAVVPQFNSFGERMFDRRKIPSEAEHKEIVRKIMSKGECL